MSIEGICKNTESRLNTLTRICGIETASIIYIDEIKVVFVSKDLAPKKQKQVILHELGHIDHTEQEYKNTKIKCENEADRNIIHHLLADALDQLENPSEFNYLDFMKCYNLKTTTEEVMVKEEYQSLLKNFIGG
ncbi:ImmA/IrrE family metallo-endopeptidase [Streptococcus sp. HMSC062D07]|jgi:hypothetical protein|uniref:ImmA/IrrE family metallo-endopeptidase n=1 Tax=Streptococcus sp. HMSC062D07 TaxID=1739461 RepID=UPI0009F1BEDB|nr:ImmA/IrrE family metallo-endopeptidase [Streptococcus sp. HMSC062D07]